MSLAFIFTAGMHLAIIRLATFLFNHMINIPLALLLGFGKYFAFFIALLIDFAQIILYYNVLNKTQLGKRFGWAVDQKLFNSYRKPEFISRLHSYWIYVGVSFLSLLPVYFGGIFAAVFTAHVLKLNKARSFIFIAIGSILGCFIWTVGIWTLIAYIAGVFHH